MKKYTSLIIAAVVLPLNLLCFWYWDVLMNRWFPFGLIPSGFVLISLITGLVISIIFLVRNRKIVQNYIALGLSVIAIAMPFVFPFRDAKLHLEFPIYEKNRLAVIEMAKNDELAVDNLGNAKLPKGYGRLSSDGEIFIIRNDEEQVVCFWVFRGMLSGSIQLIYSSTDESLIYESDMGHEVSGVERIKDHWYLVHTDD